MRNIFVMLCGVTALLLSLHTAYAETRIVLDDADSPGKWHRLALTLKGDEMRASVDGKEVARVQNEGYPGRKNGMAYLMSSYDTNCFDNVVVTP